MEELISLYDNSLIYYPNIFLPGVFFLSIVGVISISVGIIALSRKVRRVAKELKRNLYNKNNVKKKVSLVSMTSLIAITLLFLSRKKIFFIHITKLFLTQANILLARLELQFLTEANILLARLELQIRKIVKKIAKEILIDT